MDDFNFIQQYFVYEFVNLYISPKDYHLWLEHVKYCIYFVS